MQVAKQPNFSPKSSLKILILLSHEGQESPIQSASSSKKKHPIVYDHSAKVPLLENKNPIHTLGLGQLAAVCFSLDVKLEVGKGRDL